MIDNKLQHYGILGMKWGVRKDNRTKSNHRQKLESRYQLKGMTSQQAEQAAAKRIRIEKAIAITAGLTIVAAGAYVAKNEYVKNWADTKIDAGTIFKRMAQTPDGGLSERTFVTFERSDTELYKKMMKYAPGDMFQISLKSVNKVVAPSNRTHEKILKEVIKKNSEYINTAEMAEGFRNQLKSGNVRAASGAIGVLPKNSPLWKAYSEALKKEGFNAVIDYNDQGGITKKPIILLNALTDVVNVGSELIKK